MTQQTSDIYTIEALEDIRRACGTDTDAFLRRTTSIVFKPDGLARRTVGTALDFLAEHGFAPIASATFIFNRNIVREMWRDNDRFPTSEFRELVDSFIAIGPSLYVMLRLDTRDEVDASECLREVKGPSVVALRLPWHLRAKIGANSTVLSNVHTPDHWSAFLKEFGMLFATHDRRSLLDEMQSGSAPERLAKRVQALYAAYPVSDLAVPAAIERLRSAAEKRQPQTQACRDLLIQCERLLADGTADWDLILGLAQSLALELPMWDRVVIAAASLEEKPVGCRVPAKSLDN